MNVATRELFQAISARNPQQVRNALAQDCDLAAKDEHGRDALDWAIDMMTEEEDRLEIVNLLIQAGANLNPRLQDSLGYAAFAVIRNDLDLLRMLIAHGHDPNLQPLSGETVYDWARTDYIFEVWEAGFPEDPTVNDTQNEERFLSFLERLAKKHQATPPVFLRELRKAGALSFRELDDLGMV